MKNPHRKPIKFCSFGGYRPFCEPWWADVSWYLSGFHWNRSYAELGFWKQFSMGLPGWMHDILTFYRRGRYGWAPRDTWSLDHYLNGVLGGALWHLAEHNSGTPAGYPTVEAQEAEADWETHHEQWEADLKRWSTAFAEDPADVDIYDAKDRYLRHNAEEKRRRDNLNAALKEMIVWWEALWD